MKKHEKESSQHCSKIKPVNLSLKFLVTQNE